jgi:hypothetical protein
VVGDDDRFFKRGKCDDEQRFFCESQIPLKVAAGRAAAPTGSDFATLGGWDIER